MIKRWSSPEILAPVERDAHTAVGELLEHKRLFEQVAAQSAGKEVGSESAVHRCLEALGRVLLRCGRRRRLDAHTGDQAELAAGERVHAAPPAAAQTERVKRSSIIIRVSRRVSSNRWGGAHRTRQQVRMQAAWSSSRRQYASRTRSCTSSVRASSCSRRRH